MVIKRITTCIDENTWREAMLANVSWAEAMNAGIKLYIGNSAKKDQLIRKKRMLEGELRHIKKCLDEIEQGEKAVLDFETTIRKNLELIKKATPLVMEDIKRLNAWTKRWINKTHVKITKDQFFQICKRYHDVEFTKK